MVIMDLARVIVVLNTLSNLNHKRHCKPSSTLAVAVSPPPSFSRSSSAKTERPVLRARVPFQYPTLLPSHSKTTTNLLSHSQHPPSPTNQTHQPTHLSSPKKQWPSPAAKRATSSPASSNPSLPNPPPR